LIQLQTGLAQVEQQTLGKKSIIAEEPA